MEIAQAAAPEIDRLVWAASRRIAATRGADLRALAADIGLGDGGPWYGVPGLGPLPNLADFLLGEALTVEIVDRRQAYSPPAARARLLEGLAGVGLITIDSDRVLATDRLRPLLEAILAAQTEAARHWWSKSTADVEVASEFAHAVAMAASGEHVVAVAHRSLPDPYDLSGRLYKRLVTLRYIRQHDHIAAWEAEGLSAPGAVALTTAWSGDVPEPGAGLHEVVDRGLVEAEAITAEGRRLRDAIEAETNRRAGDSFRVLTDTEAQDFLAALEALPGDA